MWSPNPHPPEPSPQETRLVPRTGHVARSGDLAPEVLERERGLVDERARLVAGAEDVRPRANGLDSHRPDGIDVALDDELIAQREAPERCDLPAVLASRPGEVVVDGPPPTGGRSRALRLAVRHAQSPALRAAWKTVCWSAKPANWMTSSLGRRKISTAGSSST